MNELDFDDPRCKVDELLDTSDFLLAASAMPPSPDYDRKTVPNPLRKESEYKEFVQVKCQEFTQSVSKDEGDTKNMFETLFSNDKVVEDVKKAIRDLYAY